VDYINQMRHEGMEKRDAIREAGAARIRPVLMTAMTTVLGLIPLACGIGDGAEMVQPVAIVCIGGLLYATIMTLVIIPVIYDIFNRKNLRTIREEELTVLDI
jgi:HAE1 family hydrophobic/amphiphilic exporter-1